ncbi:MAG: hypothetical protein QOD92_2563 [Acidimicrobiaceae bacterium]|jgi:hypothetical protein
MWPSQHFTAYVHDVRSNCDYSLNPSLRIGTASVVKVEVMAGILLRAQNEGRPLTQWETDRIWPMITQSANGPTTELWQSLGRGPGMDNLDGAFGLTETTPSDPTWGLTTTSARDQVWLLRQVLLGEFGPMHHTALEQAWAPMLSVIAEQRWGITAGVPAGWPVAQKNGFAGSQCCFWRINSTGVVADPQGGAYAVAILSDGWPSMEAGIPGVEYVSRAIAAEMNRDAIATSAFYDRDGDGRDDPVVVGNGLCPAQQHWYWAASAAGYVEDLWGGRSGGCDTLLTGDVDGDGRSDPIAVRADGNGDLQWWAQRSSDGAAAYFLFGHTGDKVLVGDYDGDGRTDPTVMRPGGAGKDHTWFVLLSSGGTRAQKWGNGSFVDTPVNGDYDGDGRTDIAVVRRASNNDLEWYIQASSGASPFAAGYRFGRKGDSVVPGNWIGDRRDDLAVVRSNSGANAFQWFAIGGGGSMAIDWGEPSTDAVTPADYDGDGRTDVAVWRSTKGQNGAFWIRRSYDGGLTSRAWGVGGRDSPPYGGSVFPAP